jgi:hypothetical protein
VQRTRAEIEEWIRRLKSQPTPDRDSEQIAMKAFDMPFGIRKAGYDDLMATNGGFLRKKTFRYQKSRVIEQPVFQSLIWFIPISQKKATRD